MGLPSKFQPGKKISNLASSADIMPTVLSVCGITPPETCTGKDKSAAILNPSGMPDESVYGGVAAKWRAVVKGDYKLVVENMKDKKNVPTMLYNLAKDPYEINNLINKPGSEKIKKDLLAELDTWKKKTSDTFPDAPKDAKGMYNV
jgi:arylsulfatase A-like enzyme